MTYRLTKYSWLRYRLTKRNKEKTDTCEIWSSYSCVDEDPRLLGCYDMAWQPWQHRSSTATWLMHYEQFFDVLLWVFPQLFVSFLPDMMLTQPQCSPPPVVQTSITDKYYLLFEQLARVFRNDSNSKFLLFQQLLLLVNHVLLPFPAVLTVFNLLFSSCSTIFLPVLNFIAWSASLRNVLLHFMPRSTYKTFLSNFLF